MTNLIVFKLGGSLLDLPGLAQRVRKSIGQRPNSSALIVVGGGPAADVVRDQDRQHNLGDERAHWLAVEAMELNSRFLAEMLPEAELIANRVQRHDAVGVAILLPHEFLRQAEQSATHEPLPRTWDVTSDSIAACVATFAGARELVLLKSTALPEGVTFKHAAADGFVDLHFPRVADKLPQVSWCNLRDPVPRIVAWRQCSAAKPA